MTDTPVASTPSESSTSPDAMDPAAATRAVAEGRSAADIAGVPAEVQELLYATALGYFDGGRFKEAIELLMSLVVLDIRNPDYWSVLGNCQMREGRFAEALEAWQMTLSVKPSRIAAALVARTAIALKDRTAAAEALLIMSTRLTSEADESEFAALGEALLKLPA